MDCSTPGFLVLHHLLEFTQIHIHWVGDAIQPSHPPSLLLFLLSVFPSIRVFSNESLATHHQSTVSTRAQKHIRRRFSNDKWFSVAGIMVLFQDPKVSGCKFSSIRSLQRLRTASLSIWVLWPGWHSGWYHCLDLMQESSLVGLPWWSCGWDSVLSL